MLLYAVVRCCTLYAIRFVVINHHHHHHHQGLDQIPFDISQHTDAQLPESRKLLQRLQDDLQLYTKIT